MWQRIYQGVTHYRSSLIIKVFAFNLRTGILLTCFLLRSLLFTGFLFDNLLSGTLQDLLDLNRLFLGRYEHNHTLTLELRHLLYLTVFLQICSEAKQQHLSLLFEKNATSLKENISLNFISVSQEALSVLELEIVIMVVSLWSESDLLYVYLNLLSLNLLLMLLLLIEEFTEINQTAYRRFCIRGNLHQIYTFLFC